MVTPVDNRSLLHALAPIGLGTSDVESQTSYFCRLAHSHSMTANKLAAWVLEQNRQAIPDKFRWYLRNFASISPDSEQWSAWLSELTGVGDLDLLTLAPWRHVIAQAGVAPRADRWCPCCLKDDLDAKKVPYLRLAWDVAPVSVCAKHKVELASVCPHCERSNVRNRATLVIPGYCTHCGGFLGDVETPPATPESMWVARQVGKMLTSRPTLAGEETAYLLRTIVEKMAGGKAAVFARQFGFAKSGVWRWVTEGGALTLNAWLSVALHTGRSLDKLLCGDLEGWEPPMAPAQLSIDALASPRKGKVARTLDWEEIRTKLRAMLDEPEPISLEEASRRMNVACRLICLQATTEARAISARFKSHHRAIKVRHEADLRQQVSCIIEERLAKGYEGVSARDVLPLIPGELSSVRNVFDIIREVREERGHQT